jgi:hypothetical protein
MSEHFYLTLSGIMLKAAGCWCGPAAAQSQTGAASPFTCGTASYLEGFLCLCQRGQKGADVTSWRWESARHNVGSHGDRGLGHSYLIAGVLPWPPYVPSVDLVAQYLLRRLLVPPVYLAESLVLHLLHPALLLPPSGTLLRHCDRLSHSHVRPAL